MELKLKYGRRAVTADTPKEWKLEEIAVKKLAPLPSPAASLTSFFDNPAGGERFDAVFSGKNSVAIVVPDKTRKAGTDIILPLVLNRLMRLGISANSITVVFANGIHPEQTDDERRLIVGTALFKKHRCVDHDSKSKDLVEIGSICGKPFRINRHLALADGVIVIGLVKQHYLAGFGGGRKAIMPGVSSYENCIDFNKLCLSETGAGRDPNSSRGQLEGNRMHELSTEAARTAGVDFLFNTVSNEKGELLFLNGGDLEKSFNEAVAFTEKEADVPLKKEADIVIASCGGYPYDVNFIQSHKSLDTACRALKPGGTVILLAECRDGAGNEDFIRWFDFGSVEAIDRELRKNFAINGQTAMATLEKSSSSKVFFLSMLHPEDVVKMGIVPIKSFQDGVNICAGFAGKPIVKVIREAGVI